MKYIIIIAGLVLCSGMVQSQSDTFSTKQIEANRVSDTSAAFKGLHPGDDIPAGLRGKMLNGKQKFDIGKFDDQLLILDFMDTYCGACIEKLPELDKLQTEFKGKLVIVTVTWQKEDFVRQWMENPKGWVRKFNIKLDWIVEDKLLRNYFKHSIVSHFVWIYKGKVMAITDKEYVNASRIREVLDGKEINWPEKIDELSFDPDQPIFGLTQQQAYQQGNITTSYSGITGYRPGIDFEGGILAYDSLRNRSYFYNCSVVDVYVGLFAAMAQPKVSFLKHPGRVILEVKDNNRYVFNQRNFLDAPEPYSEWAFKNRFCYEMVSPRPLPEKERLKKMIEDLNIRFNVNARMEIRPVQCLVLLPAPGGIRPDSAKSKGITGLLPSSIALMLLNMQQQFPYAIDETNYAGYIWIRRGKGYSENLEQIKRQLEHQGINLVEKVCELEVLVISEKSNNKF